VDLVEETRQLLHLVDDDQRFSAGERLPQPFGGRTELAERVGGEQVDESGVRETAVVQERALSRLPRPEEEQRAVAERRRQVDDALVHAMIMPNYMKYGNGVAPGAGVRVEAADSGVAAAPAPQARVITTDDLGEFRVGSLPAGGTTSS
jgi:hypothetical protein